jgi:hypothetical protein
MAAADLRRLVEDGSDLGVDATFRAGEGKTFAVRLVFGDPTDGLQLTPEGASDNQAAVATTRLSVIQDALGRPPQNGDGVVIDAGAMAGEWIVSGVQLDQGDGAVLGLRYDRPFSAGRVTRS